MISLIKDRFNFARIYDNQNDADEPENISPLVTSNNSEMCKDDEPHNLTNDLIKDDILSDNKCTQSFFASKLLGTRFKLREVPRLAL